MKMFRDLIAAAIRKTGEGAQVFAVLASLFLTPVEKLEAQEAPSNSNKLVRLIRAQAYHQFQEAAFHVVLSRADSVAPSIVSGPETPWTESQFRPTGEIWKQGSIVRFVVYDQHGQEVRESLTIPSLKVEIRHSDKQVYIYTNTAIYETSLWYSEEPELSMTPPELIGLTGENVFATLFPSNAIALAKSNSARLNHGGSLPPPASLSHSCWPLQTKMPNSQYRLCLPASQHLC